MINKFSEVRRGMPQKKIIIMGAAGRDFHNFNVFFRNSDLYNVVAFTATQIPGIEGRVYPPELAGAKYPNGIPIYPEQNLAHLIKKFNIDEVVFAYSDISHTEVMHKASITLSAGADFKLMGPKSTMLKSNLPVISVGAVRTGSGKSQTTRKICNILRELGYRVVVIRHPMPYGNLKKQICQRFASYSDLDKYKCTIEEREEYELDIENKLVVYAGVDYEKILKNAERESDIIVWDGGNNDFPFIKPDLHIVVADSLRAGHELNFHPGETNVRMADIVIINKIDSAKKEDIETVRHNVETVNPRALIIKARSLITVDKPELIKNKNVLVIEDGPTLTHGQMPYGAGVIVAERFKAKKIIDPRPYALGSIKAAFDKYPHLGKVLPTVGYTKKQIEELEMTINATDCDLIIMGTPIDLRRIININKPAVRVQYELQEEGKPNLEEVLEKFTSKLN
jgi:predicted GTPase